MFPHFQNKFKIPVSVILALLVCGAFSTPALADGIIIPDPPPLPDPISLEENWLTIRYHRVSVSIEDQIAVTRVEQEFVNEHNWEVEGTYIFPIPQGASVSKFVMWVDGVPLESEILPADQARKIYEEIVRERKDPALLEYIGKDAVKARIYPIPPGGSRKIELEYSEVLEMDHGLVRYIYPLNTEKFSARYLEECAVRVELVSPQPFRSIYSPTHQNRIDIFREGEFRAVVGYEEYDVLPDQDFELIYTVSEDDIGLNLLTYPDSQSDSLFGEEGYFLLMAAPSVDVEQIVPRDIILVLDTSGSMEGGKLDQAKGAAEYVLTHLNQEDRFNLIAFSTGVKAFAYELQPASQSDRALSWISGMQALGGTNINEALLQALTINPSEKGSSRPQVVLFLTDGLPTEGITDVGQILDNVSYTADSNLRLFSFGVGDDVNTELLDNLAEENRGLVSYVRSGERIDEEVSGLFAKIQTPVLTDLEIDFGDILAEELYPADLPDLFAGSQLLVAGRYRLTGDSSGKGLIRLSGRVDALQQTYTYQVDFSKSLESPEKNSFIPRLWAARKIGYLLNQIRHQGENQEWVDAVVQLSLQYGIITPYTSFLIVEENLFYEEGRDEAAQHLQESYSGPASGAEAVDKAEAESNLRAAESVPQAIPAAENGVGDSSEAVIKYVGDKSFFLQDGVWIDSTYDPEGMEMVQIGFGTQVYFEILEAKPEWGAYFALGDQVLFVAGGKAYQIIPGESGINVLPEDLSGREPESMTEVNTEQDRGLSADRTLCTMPLMIGLAAFAVGTIRKI